MAECRECGFDREICLGQHGPTVEPTVVDDRVQVCSDCGCASSVARGCRSDWHQRPGKFTMAAMSARSADRTKQNG